MSYFSKEKVVSPGLAIPKYVRITMKMVNIVSTDFALFLASKLFITPFSFKTPKRELNMANASQKKVLHVDTINKDIHILSYGFSDKKVLLAHGWSGRCTQLFRIANKLLEKGFMVISFDAPAHGKSTGKTTNLIEYIEAIKAIEKEFGPFDAAIGHSFGSMAIMNTQSQINCFNAIVTVGSGNKTSDILYNFSNNIGLNRKFGNKLITHVEKKWKLKVDDFATQVAAEKVKTPTLIVHDITDGDVAVSCGIKIRQNLQNGKLLITEGLGHTKILRDNKTTKKIVNFIKENT